MDKVRSNKNYGKISAKKMKEVNEAVINSLGLE